MESRQLTAGPEQEGLRCDAFVADCLPEISRSAAQRLAEQGLVTRQGVALNKKDKIKAGDQIQVCLPDPAPAQAVAQPIPLDIRWEDEDVIVINKPAGMVVHPAAGNPDGTLVNALLAHCGPSLSGIGGELRPGIVHRIDKDTSGLLIVAKNDRAHQALAAQLADHTLYREYEAVALGRLRQDQGTIDRAHWPQPQRPQKNGGGARRPAGGDPLPGAGPLPGLHPCAVPAGDRTHSPDPGASGLHRPPHCRRPGLWQPGGPVQPGPPVPACPAADVRAPCHRPADDSQKRRCRRILPVFWPGCGQSGIGGEENGTI